MQIFPYLLVRLGGMPFDVLEDMNVSSVALEEYWRIYYQWYNQKQLLNEQFNKYIVKEQDYGLKKVMKNIRNDIYNNRKIDLNKAGLHRSFPEVLYKEVLLFSITNRELISKSKQVQPIVERQTKRIREQLQEHSNHPNLQNGLVLSAPSLLQRIENYQKKSVEQFKKKEHQTERTILKYLNRIAAKTSPFSTFNQIGHAELGLESSIFEYGQLQQERSFVRLNNYLFFYFKNLIINHSPTRLQLSMSLNSTYQIKQNQHYFLTNSNNIEAFQKVEEHLVVSFIIKLLKKQPLTLEKILNELNKNVDADNDALEMFVIDLFGIGLLEFDFGISGMQANWHQQLLHFLYKLEPNHFIIELIEVLEQLSKALNEYPKATPTVRLKIIKEALAVLQTIFQKNTTTSSQESNIFKQNTNTDLQISTSNLLYEDASTLLRGKISTSHIEKFTTKLDALLNTLEKIHGHSPSYLELFFFYKKHFNKRQSVPLLDVYQHFSEWKKTNTDQQFKKKGIDRVSDWEQSFSQTIKHKLNTNHINIQQDELDFSYKNAHLDDYPLSIKSKAAFIQFFQKENQLQGVVNASFPGYGKYFSRFLHLIDTKVTSKLREENALNDMIIQAEISDNSYFNANIHPPLMPFEIKTPNGHTTLPSKQQIPVNELEVRTINGILQLFHQKSGKRVQTYDLGFQSLAGRSELFKLLNIFSPAQFTHLHYLTDWIDKLVLYDNLGSETRFPRITFEENIILQRRNWHIPKLMLPKPKTSNETIIDYFFKINQWRIEQNLPQEAYFIIHPRMPSKPVDRKTDDHKPQYIHFNNPISVELFGRSLVKVEHFLKIEEMLPNSDQLSTFNEKRHVTEFLLQWRTK